MYEMVYDNIVNENGWMLKQFSRFNLTTHTCKVNIINTMLLNLLIELIYDKFIF